MQCEMSTVVTKDEKILDILKNTKTIAMVGLSPDESKASNIVARYMLDKGYKIIPIYPKEQSILGQKVYRNLEEIPCRIDMVNMFRKASFAKELYGQIKKRDDVKFFWLQLGIVNNQVGEEVLKDGLGFVQSKCLKIEYERFKEELA